MQGLEFLRQSRSDKIFLWLHYYDEPHLPYAAPPYHQELYNGGKSSWVTVDPGVVYALRGNPKYMKSIENKTLTEKDLDYLLGLYRAEVTAMDVQLGMIMENLRRSGRLDDAMIVLTSDHGEDFGERGQYLHGSNLYDGLLHVPLIMKLPGETETERVSTIARGIDIAPTILRYAGVDIPRGFHGRNLLPQLGDTTGEGVAWTFAETLLFGMAQPFKGYAFSYRSEDYKYIGIPLEESDELYDISADPHETVNLADALPEKVAEIQAEVMSLFDMEDIRELIPVKEVEIGEKQLKMLKALGYLD
jgi:arylsulfatase A-like enzyme